MEGDSGNKVIGRIKLNPVILVYIVPLCMVSGWFLHLCEQESPYFADLAWQECQTSRLHVTQPIQLRQLSVNRIKCYDRLTVCQ